MSAPAAPRPPRLLKRPVSPAQREAARRHGLYVRLHLLNAEEAQAFRTEMRNFFESMNPRGPVAVVLVSQLAFASFQLRRAFGLETEFLARNPLDITTVVRLVLAIGASDSRYSRLLYNASACLENLPKQATERKLGKRTPELIEEKEDAPASRMNSAPLLNSVRESRIISFGS